MAGRIQVCYRGYVGRQAAAAQAARLKLVAQQATAALKIQGAMRGYLGRAMVRRILEQEVCQPSTREGHVVV